MLFTDGGPSGSAYGRFQVVHNGHLDYLLAAKAKCKVLFVGIAQVLSSTPLEVMGAYWSPSKSSALTYHERETLLYEVLYEAGVKPQECQVVPFPIEAPELLVEYLPTDVPIYTTTYDDTQDLKLSLLASLGYSVSVLWHRPEKKISSEQIRRLIVNGELRRVRGLVPASSFLAIQRLDLVDRLQALDGAR